MRQRMRGFWQLQPVLALVFIISCLMQITSLFMHISPALVCWAWKWYPDPKVVRFDKMSAEQLKAYNTASWWDIGVLSMSSYMVWVVLYYLKVCPYRHMLFKTQLLHK